MIQSRRLILVNKYIKEGISMEHVVITISRQYGSGGKTIAAMLAKKLELMFTVVTFFVWLLKTAV